MVGKSSLQDQETGGHIVSVNKQRELLGPLGLPSIQSSTCHGLRACTFMMGLSSLLKLFSGNTLKGAPRGVSRMVPNPAWLSIKINDHRL